MVETVFLDWPLAFGVGLLFGLAGRREIDAAPPGFRTRSFRWGFAYLHVGIIAVSVTLYALNPDWMWMYYVRASALPVVVVAMVFAMYEASFVAGFLVGPALERARRGAGIVLAVAFGVALATAEIASRARLSHFASFDSYHAGTVRAGLTWHPFHIAPGMFVVLVPGTLSVIAVIALVWMVAKRAAARTQIESAPVSASGAAARSARTTP
ncbi:MAG: hypothetical protein ACXVP8_01460 [Actinomycetota bacterium]